MADKSITLSQSENSSSTGRKFTAYVTGCDTKHYEGSWTVPNSSYTGIGVSIDSTYITVWNENSSTSDITATFTWTSSKLSTCQKTLEVTASKSCKPIFVDWIILINDDSKGLLKSVTGDVNLWFSIIYGTSETGIGYAGKASFNEDNPEDGKIEYNPTGTINILSKCQRNITNAKFTFNEVSLDCSFSGNIPNFTVSGSIEYKINSGSYSTLTPINNYTVSSSGSSATIGNCNVTDDTIWKLCSDNGGDTLYLKHVINMNYDISVEHAYVYWKQFSQVEVTEISKTLTVNSGFVYKPNSNLVEPFVLVDEDGNMITDINEYSIVDPFGEVDLTKSCTIGTVSGGYPTHTRMSISWNNDPKLPAWVSVRNGGDTNNTSASAGFYVVAKDTRLKVTFNCNWSVNNAYQFNIQDLTWADSTFTDYSKLFNYIKINCCQDKDSICYETSSLNVSGISITANYNATTTTINATFKFNNILDLPVDLKTHINNGGGYRINMIFVYPLGESPVYSDNTLYSTNYDLDYNLSWTYNGKTPLSVKFKLEAV